jgi:hypothetical protein
MVPVADLLPPELTAIRATGLVIAVLVGAYAIARRRALRNADVLILLLVALGLAIVAGTEIPDALLSAFSFERENGTRIVGVAIFAILVLFLLVLRALSQGSRISGELSAVLEGLAWEQFRIAGHPERFEDRIGVLVPAYNEAANVGAVLDRIPPRVCGVETATLVVDDGSRDATDEVARAHGAVYRLLAESGARIVVTLDADGQHLPEEMEHLVRPVLDGEVAVAHGSRVLGEAEPNHPTREFGIVFFNRVVSFITRTHVTDCSNGYRAVRADVLPTLVLRQEQFHTSEFLIEAIKRGVPAREVPVTVVSRLSGHSKKPAVVRYGMGFANAIVRTWLR